MISEDYMDNPVFYPNRFPQVYVDSKPQYHSIHVPYNHQEGVDKPVLRKQLYRTGL